MSTFRILVWLLLSIVAASAQQQDADDILRGLIASADQQRQRLDTTPVRLHSLFVLDLYGNMLGLVKDQARLRVSETISEEFISERMGKRMMVIKRRSPAPLPLFDNFNDLGRIFTLYENRVHLLNTSIPSPLAQDAFEFYRFILAAPMSHDVQASAEKTDGLATGKTGNLVVINVASKNHLRPTFEGALTVDTITHELVSADLHLSDAMSIPLVDSLHITQRYGELPVPLSHHVTGLLRVMLMRWVSEIHAPFSGTTESSLAAMSDTLRDLLPGEFPVTIVASHADSVDTEYWLRQKRQYGERESIAARRCDSILLDAASVNNPFVFGGLPFFDYNRVGSASLGLSPNVGFGPVRLGGTGAYNFGLGRPIVEGTVTVMLLNASDISLAIKGNLFSTIATTTTTDKDYPRIVNSLVASTLHQDYYDYFGKDGGSGTIELGYGRFRLSLTGETSRQRSLPNITNWAVLSRKEFRRNPKIVEGDYRVVQMDFQWGMPRDFLSLVPITMLDFNTLLTGFAGKEMGNGEAFNSLEALALLTIPTVETGYNPMTLTLLGAAGAGSTNLPTQYQFRMRTSTATFITPESGLYGGTEYVTLAAEYNLTDLPWRALGLPLYNGRGIELILAGAGGRFRQRNTVGYLGTGDLWYSEIGIGLSKIPLIITDMIDARLDARWGLGPLGRFDVNFTLVSPF